MHGARSTMGSVQSHACLCRCSHGDDSIRIHGYQAHLCHRGEPIHSDGDGAYFTHRRIEEDITLLQNWGFIG